MFRKKLLLIVALLASAFAFNQLQAQTLASPYTVATFPTTITNINTGGGETAVGMQGACFTLPCCSVNVFKVTLPSDGVLRVEMLGFTPLAGSIIAYRPLVANPTSYADLEYISGTPGNFCGFRDTLLLGRAFRGWDGVPYGQVPQLIQPAVTGVYDFNSPSPTVGYFPAGDYYLLVFNQNQQASIGVGSTVDLTFEFGEACAPLTVPASAQFDTLEPNAGMDTASFYVKNDRTQDVTIDFPNTRITGGDSADFTVITNPTSPLAVGDSSLVEIVFTPAAPGARTSTYEIAFSDTVCSTTSNITLQGAGSEAEIVVLGNNISITNNNLTPATNNLTNMGVIITNTGSLTQSYQITNIGSDTLEFTNNPVVVLSGNSQFVVNSQPASTLLPGDTTSFSITFTPTVDGTVTTDVSIANNDVDESTFTFRVEATGAERNGLDFDGSGDYVNINDVANDMTGITALTVEAWVKVDPNQSGFDNLLAVNTSSNSNRMFIVMDDGLWEFWVGSTSRTLPGPDIRDDVWHHVAFVFDNGDITYYLDGAQTAINTNNTPTFSTSDKWSIGQEWDNSGASDFFNGGVNELRIWKTARTAQQIADDRYCEIQSPATDANLVGYYTFNQGVAGGTNTGITSITDASSYGNTGTPVGFSFTGAASNFIAATNVGVNCNSVNIKLCDVNSYTVPGGSTYTASGVYTDTLTNGMGGDSIVITALSINYLQVAQDLIADSTVCDTIQEVAQTSYTPFARFENTDGDWVEINGVVDSLVNTNRSIFLWMREADQVNSSQDMLVGINSSGTATVSNFGINTNEQLYIYDGGNSRNSGVVVTDGQWHFVGYTYDEATNFTQFWVDGVAANSFSNGQSISATSRISLGQEFDGSSTGNFYDGDMAEVTFWNEVLDSTDIAMLMQTAVQPSHPKYANLKAYYPMVSECSATGFTVKDFGPHGYDGNASAKDIVITDTLATLPGHNAAPLYDKSWARGGTQIATTDTLFLTSPLQAGSYQLDLNLDYFNVSDTWNVIVNPACAGVVASAIVDSNVSCNGFIDGGATASALGGAMPYTYQWNIGATTASITGVAAGTYSVTITDNNGLTDSASVTITEPAVLAAASIVDNNVSCNSFTDGGATASATGGTMPYNYTWSNAATTASITSAGAGTYSVTITDANGCTDSSSVTITEPGALAVTAVVDSIVRGSLPGGLSASVMNAQGGPSYLWSNGATTPTTLVFAAGTYTVTVTDVCGSKTSSAVMTAGPSASITLDSNVSCNGFLDGGATVSTIGGVTPYTYLWSNSATTVSITGVAAGTYSVTVTDDNGLTDSASVTITQPVALTALTVVDSNVSCNSFTNGGATSAATGGTMPYNYNWSNSATTASITGVGAGTYSVTITDANGCTDSTAVNITEPAQLVVNAVLDSNDMGNGGGVSANVTGGTMPYSYLWSNGSTVATISGVAAGTYTVTVTDANGCFGGTSSQTVTAGPVAATVVDSNVTCNGFTDGGASASATGGVMPYTYLWSNNATTASITGVAAGTYTVVITDNNGLTGSITVTITEPAVLTAATVVDSNVSCNSFTDGGASAAGTGGTMPYNYTWSNSATTASITGMAAGTYSVTITDANGCTDSTAVTIIEPAVLTSATVVDSNASCNGFFDGGASAAGTGGTMPYNYNWSNSATTASITGVAAGTYSVTITDANGCTDSSSVTVTEPTVLTSATVVDSNVSCNGFFDGGASVAGTGGTMPYNYAWSNGAIIASITGVAAGTYSVTITDANGCTDSSSVTVTEPAMLVAAIAVDSNESCAGALDGGLTASATGGTMPYNYIWSNSATTASITGLSAGTYTVTITDANGCTSTTTDTIKLEDVTPPTVITRNITVYLDNNGEVIITPAMVDSASFDACGIASTTLDSTNFNCSEVGANTVTLYVTDVNSNVDSATATVMVMDTTTPNVITQNITVYLDNNGEAVITPADIDNGSTDNCSIQSYALDSTNFNCGEVGANTVTLYVTDVNSNVDSATATVMVMDTTMPNVITQNITVYLDNNGEVVITPADIDNGSTDNCSIQSYALDSTNFNCGEVGANTVTLYVTDVNSNIDSATATVMVMDTTTPNVITQNITVYLDNNGEAVITPADIDNGSTDNCSIQSYALDSTNFDCGEVGANTVTLYVTDVNSNVDSAMATVMVMDTTTPNVITQNITVYLDNNGEAVITPADIDNGSTDNCSIQSYALDSTNFNCGEVGANTVTLYVTDVNSNVDSAMATVMVMDTTTPNVITQNITVYLDNNGEAVITPADIDNGSTDNCSIQSYALDSTNFNCGEVGANTVTLYVTDVNSNVDSATATVTVVDTIVPVLVVSPDTAICATDTSGTIHTFTVTGSDNCTTGGPMQIAGLPSGSVFPIGVTMNVFMISDASGLTKLDSFAVEVYDFPLLSVDTIDLLCETGAPVTLSGLPVGGTFSGAGVTGNNFDPSAVSAGSNKITYTYTTPEGCTYSIDAFAQVRLNPDVFLGSFEDTICLEQSVVACPVGTPAGGVYSGPGIDSIVLNTADAGVGQHYITYTYTDQYGCTSADSTLANIVQCLDAVGVRNIGGSGFEYTLYPNPNRGQFTLKHNSSQPLNGNIYATDGTLVRSFTLNQVEQQISIGDQAQGLYLILLTGDGINERIQFIVY